MATVPFVVAPLGGEQVTIYAEPDNLNWFLSLPLDPDTADNPSTETASVPSHTRRSYPGDATPVNVSGSQRTFLKDPTRRSGSALPGRSFILQATNGSNVTEKRQFTFKGRMQDLHGYLRENAAFDTFLYMNTGARYSIPAA